MPYEQPEKEQASNPLGFIERWKNILLGNADQDTSPSASAADTDTQEPAPASDTPVRDRVIARLKNKDAKGQSRKTLDSFADVEYGAPESDPNDVRPVSEWKTHLYADVRLIRLDKIIDDPNFANFRLHIKAESLNELQESIHNEGLKTPIHVVEAMVAGHYYVRTGFRRTLAVRNLHWQEIPAIVLPGDTPEIEEYWINIIENTAREKLTYYEMANAAKMMRDRFGVKPADFARKSALSESTIYKLLGCVDRLPPEVLQSWANGDKVPLDILVTLSNMLPAEAVKNLRLWLGQHRLNASESLVRLQKRPIRAEKLLTVAGIERTQKLMIAVKISTLDEPTKRLCMDVIEFCQGCRHRIEGIIKTDKRLPVQEFYPPEPEMQPGQPLPALPKLAPPVISRPRLDPTGASFLADIAERRGDFAERRGDFIEHQDGLTRPGTHRTSS